MSEEQPILLRLQEIENDVKVLKAGGTEAELRAELEDLTDKVIRLRAAFDAPTRQDIVHFRAKRALKYFVEHIGFFAFLVTLSVALYVYWRYGVGYFEDYQNISITKESANYYLKTGHAFLGRAEFASAESAFKTALEINPHNIGARRGLMLAQVLKPEDGHRTYIPEIVQAKLDYLKTESAFKEHPLLTYYDGRVKAAQGDRAGARERFLLSINQLNSIKHSTLPDLLNVLTDKNIELVPGKRIGNFLGNQVELGILDMYDGQIEEAISRFQAPVLAEAKQTMALNHLVQCHIREGRFDEALTLIKELYSRPPRLDTLLIIGDFFRYQHASNPTQNPRALESAKTMDTLAEGILRDADSEGPPEAKKKENLVAGVDFGRMHFLPPPLANTPGINKSVASADKLNQYKALVNYALSLDYAFTNDFKQADLYLDQALAIDTFNEYRCLFVYKLRYFNNTLKSFAPGLREWLEAKAVSTAKNCL